jgi:DNA repair exonuclease SbcCD ATPase subunit
LQAKVKELEREHESHLVQQNKEHLQAQATQAETTKSRQAELEAKIKTLSTQLKAMLGKMKEAQVEATASTQANIAQQEQLQAQLARKDAELSVLQDQLESKDEALAQVTADMEELQGSTNDHQDALAAKEEELTALSNHLEETITHIGQMKTRIEHFEESFELVYARLQEAVDKGAVAPIRPSEIKVFGTGALPSVKAVRLSIPHVVRHDNHTSYSIYLTVGQEQWKIFKRYSELLKFQQEIRTQLPGIDRLEFPPKVCV